MKHLSDEDLTLLYYGELAGRAERDARAHLAACDACRGQQDQLLRLFALVDAAPVPEPGDGYEAQVWRRLQPALRVDAGPQRVTLGERLRAWIVPPQAPRFAAVAALALVVVVAFVAGRYWQPGPQPAPATGSATPPAALAEDSTLRERILLSALGDHFDRTQGMLVELASTTPGATVDISGEQRRAEDLLAATRIYRRAAIEADDRGVADVLEALERMLVEVTVSPSRLSAYELTSLQNRIEEQQLLFKLRVAASGVREREQTGRPAVRGSAGA